MNEKRSTNSAITTHTHKSQLQVGQSSGNQLNQPILSANMTSRAIIYSQEGLPQNLNNKQLYEGKDGDSFSSEDEMCLMTKASDHIQPLLVRKQSYRFMSIIEKRHDFCQQIFAHKALPDQNYFKQSTTAKQPTNLGIYNNKVAINNKKTSQGNQQEQKQIKKTTTTTDKKSTKTSNDISKSGQPHYENQQKQTLKPISKDIPKTYQQVAANEYMVSGRQPASNKQRSVFRSFSDQNRKSSHMGQQQQVSNPHKPQDVPFQQADQDSNVYLLKDLQKDMDSYNNLLNSIDKSLTVQRTRKQDVQRQSQKDMDDYFGNQLADITGKDGYSMADQSMKSFASVFKNDELFSKGKKQILDQATQNGIYVQSLIDNAKRGDSIELPDDRIKLENLYINKPVTMIGKPGSILDICGGSIHVDFSLTNSQDVSSSVSKTMHKKDQAGSSSLSLKRSEVAMISECQIVFNRTEAWEKVQGEKFPIKQSKSSGLEKIVLQNSHQESTQSLQKDKKKGVLSCFIIENDSYIEIRDCFVKSIKDPRVVLQEQENMIMKNENEQASEIQDVEDCCFAINYESLYQQANKKQKKDYDDFVGVISLQSTTISDFYTGVLGGFNSILNCDKSSFINMRGTAISMVESRIMKVTSSVIQRTEGDGIDLKFIRNSKHQDMDLHNDEGQYDRKVLIQANRIIAMKGCPIKIQSLSQEQFDSILVQDDLSKPVQLINVNLKIINNKIYNVNKECIHLRRLNLKYCEIVKNDILKNNGSGLHMVDVRGEMNDPNKIVVRNNQITEIFTAPGIYLDNCSLTLEHNEIRKNIQQGIIITSTTQRQNCAKNHVIVINCSVQENGGFGMGINDFQGFVEIEDSLFNFNESHGIFISNESKKLAIEGKEQSILPSENTINKDQINQKVKKSQTILINTELWGNKQDGLRLNMARVHMINCKLRQNVTGAIYFEGRLSDQYLKLYCDSHHQNDIKGKIHGEHGLLYPRIQIQENLTELIEDIRKEAAIHSKDQQHEAGKVRGCFGGGGTEGSFIEGQSLNPFNKCFQCKGSRKQGPKELQKQ